MQTCDDRTLAISADRKACDLKKEVIASGSLQTACQALLSQRLKAPCRPEAWSVHASAGAVADVSQSDILLPFRRIDSAEDEIGENYRRFTLYWTWTVRCYYCCRCESMLTPGTCHSQVRHHIQQHVKRFPLQAACLTCKWASLCFRLYVLAFEGSE
jgi:hypothetical protein